MRTVTLELRDDNALVDKNGVYVATWADTFLSLTEDKSKNTIELIKLGVSSEEIIKLKNQGLL